MAVGSPTGFLFSTENVAGKTPLHITADKQVQVTVLIVVEESGTGSPAIGLDFGLGGHIREAAVAVVVIKDGVPVIRHIEVGKAVVVVICCRHTHSVTFSL